MNNQNIPSTSSVAHFASVLVGYFSRRVSGKAANISIFFAVVTYLLALYVVKPILVVRQL
jgi:SSS family solute:Na+ symporter